MESRLKKFAARHRNSVFGKSVLSATEMGDADTADLFTEVSRGIDKLLWFAEAQAQRSGDR